MTQPAPTLPPNVTIFNPKSRSTAQSLLHGRRFTRLSASASTSPEQLSKALRSHAGLDETFYFSHGRAVLIFHGGDGTEGGDAHLENAHHEHFRAVCLALKDADIGLDVAKCVHDAESVLQAGYQLDAMNDGSVLVIDLMHTDDEDDVDSEEEDEGPTRRTGHDDGTVPEKDVERS
ncbi:hypothetical protein DPSP01_000505 [Paraphaeosphaeria sporulosa]|uniref:Uncharacterized protein n=1 Tax=Paraphaeosphaeria sporulosa TaxID=1460663 RepID=A0A177C7T6_9PLEO|nr:uncharacterized protein CC84DRAFT_1218917 [Paraphaeosphaeria sporulosa]OAG03615.1 hypothetical protein CC84DRAFT_1218917 [Paraphaeosphaeria sporulosa]